MVAALLRKQVGPDDDVGDPRLVLEREEHEPFRRARPLPRDDRAGHAHPPPVPPARQIARAQHAAQRQLRPPQRHRVRPDGQARAGVVGQQALGHGHRAEGSRRVTAMFDGRWPSHVDRPTRAFSSKSSPAGRTACSTCQSAVRRSKPNAFSAPISASVATSSRRSPQRRMRWSRVSNRGASRAIEGRSRMADCAMADRAEWMRCWTRQRPQMRADVAEPFVRVQRFEHRRDRRSRILGHRSDRLRAPIDLDPRSSILGPRSSEHAAIASARLPAAGHSRTSGRAAPGRRARRGTASPRPARRSARSGRRGAARP